MNTLYSRPDFYCHKLQYLTEMELVEWASKFTPHDDSLRHTLCLKPPQFDLIQMQNTEHVNSR